MNTGLSLVGVLGIAYSVFFDEMAFLVLFNTNPYSVHCFSTVSMSVCVLAGIARMVVAIYCFLSSFAPIGSEDMVPSVVDIRCIQDSKRRGGKAL